jgi:hypothetical protein
LLGRGAIDLAINREDRVDALHRFDGDWRLAQSASSKNLRRLWLQQAASVIRPGLRFAS